MSMAKMFKVRLRPCGAAECSKALVKPVALKGVRILPRLKKLIDHPIGQRNK